MTEAHLWNRQEMTIQPLPDADWYDEEDDLVGFITNVTITDSRRCERAGIGGKRENFIRSTVPICKKCREMEVRIETEARVAREMQAWGRRLDGRGSAVTIGGFEKRAGLNAVSRGDAIELERCSNIDTAVEVRRRFYLDMMVAAIALSRRDDETRENRVDMEEIRELARKSNVWKETRIASAKEHRPRVRIFSSDAAERWASRILRLRRKTRRLESDARNLAAMCRKEETAAKTGGGGNEEKNRNSFLYSLFRIHTAIDKIIQRNPELKGAIIAKKDLERAQKMTEYQNARKTTADEAAKALEGTARRAKQAAEMIAAAARETINREERTEWMSEETERIRNGTGMYATAFMPWKSPDQERQVIGILKKHGVERGCVFGSFTTDEGPNEKSDVDFVVWWREPETRETGTPRVWALNEDLEKATGRKAHVIENPGDEKDEVMGRNWREELVEIFTGEEDPR